jgi:outer membrane immunogenic protein
MRTPILLLAAVSTVLLVVGATDPANAQDRSFTGPRVEMNAGYDATHADDGIASTPNSLDGIRVGAAAGYDVSVGSIFTIGAEIGLGWQLQGSLDYGSGATRAQLTSGYDFDASLRVGARVAPRTLLFVKAGYANSEYRARIGTGDTVKDDNDGYRLGAGVEQALGKHLYAKAEYRYTDYGDDVTRHQVLAGLGWRF